MNIKKPALLLVFSLLASCPIFAQEQAQAQAPAPAQTPAGGTGSVYGRILDGATQNYMPSAIVSIEGANITVTTDQGGFYVLNAVPAGEATVMVQYAGYVTQRQTLTVPARGRVSADFTMGLTPSAQTKVTGTTGESVVQMDAFHVTSDRVGNARAFMSQKASMTMSTVLATDSFGTIQNGNAAEFLRNLPGISINDDDNTGEASTVSIGGMDPQYTAVNMDGARMASGAKGSFGDDSRTFQFDTTSIDNVDTIEIHRMTLPDMAGDAPAGTIDMTTKSAFDRKSTVFTYNAFLSANSFEMNLKKTPGADDGSSIKIQPGISFNYILPFARNTMGLTIQAGYQQDFSENNRANINIYQGSWNSENPYPTSVVYRNVQTQSTRANASIGYDYKISPFSSIRVRAGYSYRNATIFNRTASFVAGSTSTHGLNAYTSNLTYWQSEEDQGGTDVTVQQNGDYQSTHRYDLSAAFKWQRYRFLLTAVASFSYAQGLDDPTGKNSYFSQVNIRSKSSNSSSNILWGQRPSSRTMDWSFYRGNENSLTVTDSLQQQMGDIAYYGQSNNQSLLVQYEDTNTEQIPALKADLRWTAPTPFQLWFKTGIVAQDDKKDAWQPTISGGSRLASHYQYIGTNGINSVGGATGEGNQLRNYDALYGSANDTTTPGLYSLSSNYFRSAYQFDPQMGGNIGSLNIPMVNQTLLYQTFLQHPEWFYQNLNDRANTRIAGYTAPVNLEETIAAWYLMGTIQPMRRLTISGGYRYEYTDQTALTLIPLTAGSVAKALGTTTNPTDQITDQFVDMMYRHGQRTKTEKTYSFWLPSVTARYEFTPNLDAMIGYAENFGRLNVSNIAGNWKISDSNATATAPNPNLTPDHYKTFAVQMAYYFEPAGSLTLNYSVRKWDGVTYSPVAIDSSNTSSPEMQNLINLYGLDTIQTFVNNNYTIYTYLPSNANNNAMQTIELGYRQNIPGIPGLTVDTSFTRIIPNWRKYGSASMPKQASVGLTWKYMDFMIRVSGKWTDRYWLRYDYTEQDPYNNQGAYARFVLRAEASYRFTKQFSIYLLGNNITNEDNSQWTGAPDIITQETKLGTIWQLGVRGEF